MQLHELLEELLSRGYDSVTIRAEGIDATYRATKVPGVLVVVTQPVGQQQPDHVAERLARARGGRGGYLARYHRLVCLECHETIVGIPAELEEHACPGGDAARAYRHQSGRDPLTGLPVASRGAREPA